jgi:hypothetical protein
MAGPRALRPSAALGVLDKWILRMSRTEGRLIGLSVLRIILGASTAIFYLSDYGHRQFFWGPHAYITMADASNHKISHFSFFFVAGGSQIWFEIVFNLGILVAILFAIFGGRVLAICHVVFLWSLYTRNPDILEGGDNLARILAIFMVFTVTNAYFAPGARKRRAKPAVAAGRPQVRTLLHNVAAFLIVFQIAVLYFWAGYWKVVGSVWRQGVAMYYISRINGFHMFGSYSTVMSNPYLGTAVSYFTTFIEVAFPFAIISRRAWMRKLETFALEGLHLGIMAFMGLVCFGLIMIGADLVSLTDDDYRSLWSRAQPLAVRARSRIGVHVPRTTAAPKPLTPEGG